MHVTAETGRKLMTQSRILRTRAWSFPDLL